jgi:hypothetical protein
MHETTENRTDIYRDIRADSLHQHVFIMRKADGDGGGGRRAKTLH